MPTAVWAMRDVRPVAGDERATLVAEWASVARANGWSAELWTDGRGEADAAMHDSTGILADVPIRRIARRSARETGFGVAIAGRLLRSRDVALLHIHNGQARTRSALHLLARLRGVDVVRSSMVRVQDGPPTIIARRIGSRPESVRELPLPIPVEIPTNPATIAANSRFSARTAPRIVVVGERATAEASDTLRRAIEQARSRLPRIEVMWVPGRVTGESAEASERRRRLESGGWIRPMPATWEAWRATIADAAAVVAIPSGDPAESVGDRIAIWHAGAAGVPVVSRASLWLPGVPTSAYRPAPTGSGDAAEEEWGRLLRLAYDGRLPSLTDRGRILAERGTVHAAGREAYRALLAEIHPGPSAG